jgi:hypothetical protein
MSFLSYIRQLREQLGSSSPRARTTRRKAGAPARPRRSVVPGVEVLECRLTPVTNRWTGGVGAGPFLWSNPSNWTLGRPPINGDDLVFGPIGLAAAQSTRNDLTGLVLNSITIQTTGYTLAPNAAGSNGITLNNTSGGDSLIVNAGALNNVISLDVSLGGAGTRQFFDVGSGGGVTLTGELLDALPLTPAELAATLRDQSPSSRASWPSPTPRPWAATPTPPPCSRTPSSR